MACGVMSVIGLLISSMVCMVFYMVTTGQIVA